MSVIFDSAMGDFENFLEAVGRRLQERRRQARLTQSELADATGLSRLTIVNIEGGQQPVKISTLWILANKLGIQLKDLIPDEAITNSVASSYSAADAEYANRVANGFL